VTLETASGGGRSSVAIVCSIKKFIAHAERQIDQIHRRVILGEKIPHDLSAIRQAGEKVFSIFEEPERISKGKAGVPVELEAYAIWP